MIVNGINTKHFENGWWGEHGEGNSLLNELGLPADKVPFSVGGFLKNMSLSFSDSNGETVWVGFKMDEERFEFSCKYLGKLRVTKLFREWQREDIDTILMMESYSIGECVRKIIAGNSLI